MVNKHKTTDDGGIDDIRAEKVTTDRVDAEVRPPADSELDEDVEVSDNQAGSKEQNDSDDSIMNGDGSAGGAALLKQQLMKKDEELKEYVALVQRVKAEFDNFKKRTSREREQLYTDITGDIIARFLPVIDNLERAAYSASENSDTEKVVEGLKLILNQLKDILTKEGVEEIAALGEQFDPNFHNAVMHVEDENYGSNTVIEVFQKGYRIKEKVLRYSAVKVAN